MKLVSKSGRNNTQSTTRVRSNTTVNGTVPVNRTSANRSAAPVRSTNPSTRKKSPVKAILIFFLVLIIGCGGLFVGLCFYVDSLDTVFPNVWAEGIKVSGLTLEEAKQTLINEGYENNAEGISAMIVFPDDSSFTVTGEEVGLSYNAEEAATVAFKFGRDESFFGSAIVYIQSVLDRTDLNDLSSPSFNDTVVRQLAAEYTTRFNETLFDSDLDYNDSFITVVKGTGIHPAIENDVFNIVIHALTRSAEEHEHMTVNYIPEANLADSVEAQINELQMLFDHINEEPVSSQLIFLDDADDDEQSFVVTDSSNGRTFDLETAKQQLRSAEYGATIVIPINILEPEYSQEEMEAMLFRDVLAESRTRLTNNSNRTSNVRLAAGFINETIFNPGALFSFNEVVGRRTRDRGFLEAPVIIGGRLQPGIGGGICQVSSTIYDALLKAAPFDTDIEIVERRPHGLTISYLAAGFDATVAYGNIDFKFRNKMDFPIKLETFVDGGEMVARIIGTNVNGSYIETESSDVVSIGFSVINEDTDELYIGETRVFTGGQNGARVDIFQNYFNAAGELIRRIEIGTSRYGAQNRVIQHGTAEPPPPVHDPWVDWEDNSQHETE